MLTVFVPAHVNRDNILTCFVDNHTTFIEVETEQQAIEQQGDSKEPFIVFEADYFTLHNIPEGPVKCDYTSRNYISRLNPWNYDSQLKWRCLSERDGLKFNPKPPIVYFIHENCIGKIDKDWADENTIVQYYTERNLEQFAEFTIALEGYCNHCFIIYDNGSFQCVDTNNTDNIYSFSESLQWHFVSDVRMDITAMDRYREQDRRLKDPQPPSRLPNGEFKLKDENGDEVLDGEQFNLIIPRDDDEDYGDEDEDYEPEQDGINASGGELMASPRYGDIFSCETIDGTVYLTHNGGYLGCPDEMNSICVSPELPGPSERLQINYDGNDITLTIWGELAFATCDWIKASVGFINFVDDENSHRFGEPMRLRLIKHRRPID
ncbi:hypothetical protein FBU59_000028 [Linderina macrospora]|uniref:Uncharacterized protein n=1 Tax=Linderina macrospora TaxID=4868 RepID=A0ACC1JI98_9FUNG|nr:hypothetical protein FBU59_000028 [Linderina macrospora]